ncbi:hypothetical protein AB0M91_19515 [Micromonospora rifamycinica]|uniref:hypothetical protein n=1 Tax=Micromonospora rifamycinica TaxID=291594 RepID=UPI0034261C96
MSYATGDSLAVRIRIAFGADLSASSASWTWTDVTEWWHVPEDVAITWGRSDRAEQAETSSLSLALKNDDGRFSYGNPTSPYWPYVVQWVPISFDIDLGDGSGWRSRFSGYVRRWPVAWPGRSSQMALTRIEAVGVLGRLGRGSPPDLSPSRRANAAPAGLLAYWPLEDEPDATQAASAVSGVAPMFARGPVVFGFGAVYLSEGATTRYGTKALPTLIGGGGLIGVVPAGTAQQWAVQVFYQSADGGDDDLVQLRWHTTGGTYTQWDLVQDRGGVDGTYLVAYTPAGTPAVVWSAATTFGGPAELVIAAAQNGGNIDITVRFDSYVSTASVAGTLAPIGGEIGLNPELFVFSPGERFVVGHLRAYNRADIVPATSAALRAYAGETATARMVRLAAEDGLTCAVVTPASPVDTTMGAQPDGTPLALYQQVETTDGGLLYESGYGLGYLPRAARYNPPVALTIDAADRELAWPFEPVADDVGLRNVITVNRDGGSSATAIDQQSIALQGRMEGSVTVNLSRDAPLADHAGWWLRRSSVSGLRYPSLSLNLTAARGLATAWCDCAPGARVQVVNPPEQSPGTVDQLVVGATEVFRGRTGWRVTLNVEAVTPWMVARVGGEQRIPARGSTLAVALDEGGQAAVVDAYGRTVAAGGWGTADSGGAWTVEGTAADYSVTGGRGRMSLGSVLVSRRAIVGSTGLTDCDVVASVWAPVAVGGDIQPMLALRYTDNNNCYLAVLELRTDGSIWAGLERRVGGVQSTLGKVRTTLTHVGTSTGLRWRARATGTSLAMRVWAAGTAEPTGWDLVTSDASLTSGRAACRAILGTGNSNSLPVLVEWDDVAVYDATTMQLASTAANGVWTTNAAYMPLDLRIGGERVTASAISGGTSPQTVTLAARGVNGGRRAWAAGTEVDVWQPAIAPL